MIEGVTFERLVTGRLSYQIFRNRRPIGICAKSPGGRWGAVPMHGRAEIENRLTREEAVQALIDLLDAMP